MSKYVTREDIPLIPKKSGEDLIPTISTFVMLSILVIVALALSAGLGGAALHEALKPFFKVRGGVISYGNIVNIQNFCTNDTVSTAKVVNIGKGNTLEFYNSCPRPRTACEVAICGTDGICDTQLATGKECASSAECSTLFNSSGYYCDTTTCTCVNDTTGNSTFCCDWIDFTPENITAINLTLDTVVRWFQYRDSGTPPAHVEMNGHFFILTSDLSQSFAIVLNISDTGLGLDTTGNFNGFGSLFPLSTYSTAKVSATGSSEITISISALSPTVLASSFINFVFYANLQ